MIQGKRRPLSICGLNSSPILKHEGVPRVAPFVLFETVECLWPVSYESYYIGRIEGTGE
jgi:hypothetical protein